MRALLSIKPVHADSIFSGRKKFEYRRKLFARTDIRAVLVYSTKPVGKFVGEFEIDGIIKASPRSVWEQTWQYSGISEQYFFDYFAGCHIAHAIRIGALRPFSEMINPGDLIENFSPPQSFMYVNDSPVTSDLFGER